MKTTVCELNDDTPLFARDWQALVEHVQDQRSDLVLLPELAFAPWFGWRRDFDPAVWRQTVAAHQAWIPRLAELAPAAVLGTLPVDVNDRRQNVAFAWEAGSGLRPVHAKYYLPDDPGFWEASWYDRGEGDIQPVSIHGIDVGFQICTELWFFERARAYGKQGVHVIANPRATEKATVDKWLAGGRAAAVVSGTYCLSSNKVNREGREVSLGGQGWVIDPDGNVLALTSRDRPFVTMEIDPAQADKAKDTYPRYVRE